MKRILTILAAAALAVSALSSCGGYDDSAILSDISDLKGRVSVLEEQMRAANNDISTLQQLKFPAPI